MPGACTTRWSAWAGRDVTARRPATRPTGMLTPSGSRNVCVDGPTQTSSASAELALARAGIRPLERATGVMAGIAAELARQLLVRDHPVDVQAIVVFRLLPARVQPRERRPARPGARDAGVERQHARARAS